MTEATEEASSRHVDPAPMASDPPVSLRPYAFVLAAVILGGLAPVFTKLLLLRGVEGPTIVDARYALSVLLLLPFGFPTERVRGRRPTAGPGSRSSRRRLRLRAGALLFTAAKWTCLRGRSERDQPSRSCRSSRILPSSGSIAPAADRYGGRRYTDRRRRVDSVAARLRAPAR